MVYAMLIVVGLAAGAAGVWIWMNSRVSRAERAASAAEGTIAELRGQVGTAAEDFGRLRASLDTESQARVRAETRLAEAARNLEEQKKTFEDAKRTLEQTFEALAGKALRSSNESFLQLAKESLETVLAEGKGDLQKRQQAVDELVKPLMESLNRYEGHVRALEESRQKAYGSLEEQIKSLNETQRALRDRTDALVTALRRPEVRGRWGEITLKRVAELSGMVEHCDFEEQVSVGSDEGRLRPDMLVHLPAGREIVVDAKVPLDAYLDAVSAEDENKRAAHLSRHARQMRTHMNQLSAKSYWEQLPRTPALVVMFIPGESFFSAALESDRTLLEDGMAKRVVLASPTTLIALLHAVAYGWREQQLTRNAQEISELGRQLYERLITFSEHFEDVRKGLERANEAFNKAVGSMEARVFPAARRFRDLGVAPAPEIAVVEPVETTPRVLNLPDAEESDDRLPQ